VIHEGQAAKTFQDLLVWQRAHAFVLGVYRRKKPAFEMGRELKFTFPE
jgi:hypothetical protein